MQLVVENAKLSVGASPGFRTLSIRDPSLPWLEILVPMTSFAAAEASKHLLEGDPDPEEAQKVRELRTVEMPAGVR
jgi:hypothetical protein